MYLTAKVTKLFIYLYIYFINNKPKVTNKDLRYVFQIGWFLYDVY